MNRREFFKVLGVAGVVAVVPAALVLPETNPLLPVRMGNYDGFALQRMIRLFDYDTQIGLGVSLRRGDNRWRHAVRLHTALWEQFTPEQQEETWRFVERATYNVAMKQSAWAGLTFPDCIV